jgi:hypothetical protein
MNQPGHIENVVAAKDQEKVDRNRLRLKASVAAISGGSHSSLVLSEDMMRKLTQKIKGTFSNC